MEQQQSVRFWSLIMCGLLMLIAMLACGGNTGSIGMDITAQPENMIIDGLPQYICPSATPLATRTQMPTAVQPNIPPSGYVTYTPYPGGVWSTPYGLTPMHYMTYTPFPGGFYSTPSRPGATSTPRKTHTPYPSPTPFVSSYFYFFNDDVYTQYASDLNLRLRIGNIRTYPSAQAGQQISVFEVQLENRGSNFYYILAPLQIYVSQVGTQTGIWYSNIEAARERGITPHTAATDGYQLNIGQSVTFDLYTYTPVGAVQSVAYILNPYGNGYDGQIAGGNVAYWRDGSRVDCRGNVDGGVNPPTPSTPRPTATITATLRGCAGAACITQIP